MSYRDYIHARLPFFQTFEGESLTERSMMRSIKSVAEQDRSMDISFQVNIRQDGKIAGCMICEENLVDSILVPCRYVFCKLCIRDSMHEGSTIRCAACRKVVNSTISFAAPMEISFAVSATVEPEGGTDHSTRLPADEKVDVIASLWQEPLSSSIKSQGRSKSPLPRGDSTKTAASYECNRTPMQLAASLGQIDVVAQLIEDGINVNETPRGADGKTAPQAAVEQGHLEVVSQLLAAGADPNDPVSPIGGHSALEIAAGNSRLAIVAQLLRHGALPISAPTRKSALHAAAENGDEAVVALLLAYGYDPDVAVRLLDGEVNSDKMSSNENLRRRLKNNDVRRSHLAAGNGHLGVLKLLRTHGATGMVADAYCTNAACASGYLEIISWFLNWEEEIDATQTTEEYKLTNELSTLGIAESLRYLYPPPFSFLPVRERLREKLVHTAVEHGQLEILRMLVRRGACLSIPEPQSRQADDHERPIYVLPTLLHKAAGSGSI
jgi:hypothetical protein